ncbi:MAG TPA: MFS transporter [Ktedonobacterales bacterium]
MGHTSPVKAPLGPSAESLPRPLRMLINRNFALLWAGQTVSQLGDSIFAITLVLWVATLIAGAQPWAPLAVGGVLLASIAPEFLVSPIAGVVADRGNRRTIMLSMDASRAVLIALLVLATGRIPLPYVPGGQLPLEWQLGAIYAIVFLGSVCSQFFNPALFACIAITVEEPQRARASGLRQTSASIAGIAGPALAAALFFGAGLEWALLLNALSFVASFLAILAISPSDVAPTDTAEEAQDTEPHAQLRESFLRAFWAGLRFYFGNRILVTLLVTAVLTLLAFGSLNTLDIFFVTQNLHATADFYAILTSAQGLGLLVGAIFAAAFAQRIGVARVLGLSLLVWGVTILVYARLTDVAPALVLMGITGFLLSAAQVAETPLLMHATPQAFLGRVSSVFVPALSGSELVGIGLSGYLASTLLRGFHATVFGIPIGPIDTIFTAMGLALVAAGVYALVNLRGVRLAQSPPRKYPR